MGTWKPGSALAIFCAATLSACIPEGPPTRENTAPTLGPSGSASTQAAAVTDFEDRFEREDLGPNYNALSSAWRIEQGRLCARDAKNNGVWLVRPLAKNARIEFDAIAESSDGDLKAELWGDGRTGATGVSYNNATSYVVVLGGWKNSRHVLARLDEHGRDRLEIAVAPGSDDERARPVAVGQAYHFVVERSNGRTITARIDGVTYFEFDDPQPLEGSGHDHFGFNEWQAPACFDNLKVKSL